MTESHGFDATLRLALGKAIPTLSTTAAAFGPNPLQEKKHFQPALLAALRDLLPPGRVHSEKKLVFDDFYKVGAVDVVVGDPDGWEALIELKWCPADGLYMSWAIWDFYKMAVGRVSPGADGCYLVACAPDTLWDQPTSVAALFQTATWNMPNVYSRYEKIFIGDGVAYKKLKRLPARVDTILVANEPLASPIADWRIRAIRIEPQAGPWQTLVGGRLAPGAVPAARETGNNASGG